MLYVIISKLHFHLSICFGGKCDFNTWRLVYLARETEISSQSLEGGGQGGGKGSAHGESSEEGGKGQGGGKGALESPSSFYGKGKPAFEGWSSDMQWADWTIQELESEVEQAQRASLLKEETAQRFEVEYAAACRVCCSTRLKWKLF